MNKLNKEKELDFKYTIGSNVIKVNSEIKYLSIIIWDEVTYDEIKKYIVE